MGRSICAGSFEVGWVYLGRGFELNRNYAGEYLIEQLERMGQKYSYVDRDTELKGFDRVRIMWAAEGANRGVGG